ncbi:MAG: hypothetical protein OJF61_002041 [Rhodanobacteraceae bacterium]|nr:MAG: hypothetical protein OJF61_002041 [Rhodanobacteraceae bacterium]
MRMAETDDKQRSRARQIRWDAVAAIIASLVGFLALVVAAYTAYIERYIAEIQTKQVQAQVWPWMEAGNNDTTFAIEVYNKGVGPAIVRSAQIWVDGKPQTNWDHALDALGVAKPRPYSESTIYPGVVSAGETVPVIKFASSEPYQQFRTAAIQKHMTIAICYCSTLGECWRYRDEHLVGYKQGTLKVDPVAQCPRVAPSDVFNN